MKNLKVALCDQNEDYILKLANYFMEIPQVSVHIFTTPEGFFADENDYDVTVLTEDFQDITDFRPKGTTGHKYHLIEDFDTESEDCIYRFQAVDNILNEIHELRKVGNTGSKKSNGTSKLVGIFSPASHELSLPFSMAVSQSYRTSGRVLFLDIEEVSILPKLIGDACERNLMDLLYEQSTSEKLDLSKYVRSFMGFDYVTPFENPNEISEIDEETWSGFFEALEQSSYDVVIVLFGRAINGFSGFIEKLNKLYVLNRPGDYFKMSQDSFLTYIEKINATEKVENVLLPMSAGNLSEGTYQIEELLQGNLGVFVKKLINVNTKNLMKQYV